MKPIAYGETLPVGSIRQSPYHFRKETSDVKLAELTESIQKLGLIHAVSVVRYPDGRLDLVNGHRRLLAHKRGGILQIRANVYEFDANELGDEQRQQQAVVQFLLAANSNEPLIPVERARAYED